MPAVEVKREDIAIPDFRLSGEEESWLLDRNRALYFILFLRNPITSTTDFKTEFRHRRQIQIESTVAGAGGASDRAVVVAPLVSTESLSGGKRFLAN